MSKLKKLAEILSDGKPHTSTELVEKVGHRFGAYLLQLRNGELRDNYFLNYWTISGSPMKGGKGVWTYRLTGFSDRYITAGKTCSKCACKSTLSHEDIVESWNAMREIYVVELNK